MGTVALTMLAMEVGPTVRALAHWEPVGVFAEQLVGTVAGTDGLRRQDIDRIRSWHRRWQALRPDLRAFYAEHCQVNTAVSAVLWFVLEGRPDRALARPGLAAAVHQLYRAEHGHQPPWSLLPRVP